MAYSKAKKQQIVKQLIANCDCWTDDDADILFNLSDASLDREVKRVKSEIKTKEQEAVFNAAIQPFKVGNIEVTWNQKTNQWETKEMNKEEVTTNTTEPPKEMTEDQWFQLAPANVRAAVRNAMSIEEQERKSLVDQITVNVEDEEEKKTLVANFSTKSLEELKQIATLIPKQKEQPTGRFASYVGQNVMATNARRLSKEDQGDVLQIPTINFAELSKQRSTA